MNINDICIKYVLNFTKLVFITLQLHQCVYIPLAAFIMMKCGIKGRSSSAA